MVLGGVGQGGVNISDSGLFCGLKLLNLTGGGKILLPLLELFVVDGGATNGIGVVSPLILDSILSNLCFNISNSLIVILF